MPRFVLLYHECPVGFNKPSHWDFMLEADGVLQTWELRELPNPWLEPLGLTTGPNRPIFSTRLADHRLDYLTFEGLLSENRGSVTRVAEGTFLVIEVEAGSLTVSLHGQTIQGIIVLTRYAESEDWQLTADV